MSTAAPAALGPVELQQLAAMVSLLTRAGDVDSLLQHIPETHSNRLHLGYNEAAKRLNIPEKWLRERIGTLPHRKFGKFVQFTEDDLRAISDMHFVQPGRPAGSKNASAPTSSLRPSARAHSRS